MVGVVEALEGRHARAQVRALAEALGAEEELVEGVVEGLDHGIPPRLGEGDEHRRHPEAEAEAHATGRRRVLEGTSQLSSLKRSGIPSRPQMWMTALAVGVSALESCSSQPAAPGQVDDVEHEERDRATGVAWPDEVALLAGVGRSSGGVGYGVPLGVRRSRRGRRGTPARCTTRSMIQLGGTARIPSVRSSQAIAVAPICAQGSACNAGAPRG